MKAYVLIKVRAGEVAGVVRHLHRVASLTSAEMTFGQYDAIAILEAESLETMGRTIALDIQTIPGVESTNTCLAVDLP